VVVARAIQRLQLNWIDASSNEDGFGIQRGDQFIDIVGPNVMAYVDFSWTPSMVTCYHVVAFNEVGTAPSNQACPGTTSNVILPPPPTNLRLSPGPGNGVQLNWTDTSTNEDGFEIVRGGQAVTIVGPNVTTYSDTLGNFSIQTCYHVNSFNNAGLGVSNVACTQGAAPNTPPTAPTNVIASSYNDGSRELQVTWTRSTDNVTPQSLILYQVLVNGLVDNSSIGVAQTSVYGVAGDNVISVVAIDVNGNASAPGSVTLNIPF